MTMLIHRGIVIVSLLLVTSVLLVYPLQSINAQTFEPNSTQVNVTSSRQANITASSSPIQWAVYTNDRFGFSIEYPQLWITEERQNRFENTVEAALIAPGDRLDPNWGRFNLLYVSPATTSNIRVLTNIW